MKIFKTQILTINYFQMIYTKCKFQKCCWKFNGLTHKKSMLIIFVTCGSRGSVDRNNPSLHLRQTTLLVNDKLSKIKLCYKYIIKFHLLRFNYEGFKYVIQFGMMLNLSCLFVLMARRLAVANHALN